MRKRRLHFHRGIQTLRKLSGSLNDSVPMVQKDARCGTLACDQWTVCKPKNKMYKIVVVTSLHHNNFKRVPRPTLAHCQSPAHTAPK